MTGALAGIRVVDFGQYVAGPLAAMLLAEQGADVVRIDPPGGPRLRSPANATWNRSKRCIVLDLKTEAGRAEALDRVAAADIVIENFRPGRMAALGLGAMAMTARDPRLVYCSLPGFGTGDDRAALPGWEGVVGAATDTYRPLPGGDPDRPVYIGIPVASNFAAVHAAAACTMALIARARDGLGQRIEVALHDAMFSAIGARGMVLPQPEQAPLETTGFGNYACRDGRCVHFAPVMPRFMDWFAVAAGIQDWRGDGLFDRARLASEPAQLARLRERLAALFLTRDAVAWEDLAAAAGTPMAVCRTMAEWTETPHARQSGAVAAVDDPVHGAMLQPGIPVRLSRTPGQIGAPSDAVWAPRAASPACPVDGRPALAGLRVLDLTQVWAGPTAARLLAEYGADVIKINSPHEPILSHVDVNRGKRTILLDLAAQDGQAVFWRLVETADVVLQNFSQGVAERIGIGEAAVRRRRPDIVYSSVSCYGYDGPWGARRGYEVQGQAAAGAQAQFGGPGDARRLPYEINDYGTGLLAAFATALAIFHRARTGEGQATEAALAYTATLHQSLYLHAYPGKVWDEPGGPLATGTRALHRLYRAQDAWFFLGARDDQRAALDTVPGLAGLADTGDLAAALEARFATAPAGTWVRDLAAAGLGAHRLRPVDELMRDPRSVARGLSLTRDHEGVGTVRTIGPVPTLSRTPLRAGRPAPLPGADGVAIRAELRHAAC